MPQWIDVGAETDYPVGAQVCLNKDKLPLVIFNLEGTGLKAIANICPHAGLPLGQGELDGTILTCPFHGYAYDVTSGKNADFPDTEIPLTTFPIRVNNGRIEIDINRGK